MGGARVGAEEVDVRAVRQDHRIAGERDAAGLLRELHDVLAEDVRLCLAGRQEDLVAPGLQRVDESFMREVPGRADLPALEHHARALVPVAEPHLLMAEEGVLKRLVQLVGLLIGEVVALRLLLRPGIALLDLGVEIDFLTTHVELEVAASNIAEPSSIEDD